jgi:glycosyltransferase involved in cell wall biosynthesis
MRILIDGGCWRNARGYGRFTRELLGALARVPRHEYTVLMEEQAREDYDLPLPAVFVKPSIPAGEAATASGRRSIRDLLLMSRAAASAAPAGLFFPSVYSYFPIVRPVNALLGVHDTMADRFPEFAFDSLTQQRFWRWKMRLALWQCRDVLTVSEYSKKSIAGHWKTPVNHIHVIPEGPATFFKPQAIPKRDVVLSVGGISPNKNLSALIRAFRRVRTGIELWIAGDYQSDGFKTCYRELADLAANLPVRFLGRVTDEDLCRLYNEARLLAFPSVEEGFGLPAVEAMACGLPVVAHDGHAVAEVVGGAGVLVDARDENALASAINRVLDNSSLAEQLRARGLERASRYSWQRAANELQDIFDSIWP